MELLLLIVLAVVAFGGFRLGVGDLEGGTLAGAAALFVVVPMGLWAALNLGAAVFGWSAFRPADIRYVLLLLGLIAATFGIAWTVGRWRRTPRSH